MACDNLRQVLNGDTSCFSNSSSAEEHKKRFILNNPSRKSICKVHVDNCLIKDQTIQKCDYLFNVLEDNRFYLVELKGQAIDVAVDQIRSTFDIVNSRVNTTPDRYTGIIVSSAVPKAANQRFKNLQDKLFRDKKLLVKRKSFVYEEVI